MGFILGLYMDNGTENGNLNGTYRRNLGYAKVI